MLEAILVAIVCVLGAILMDRLLRFPRISTDSGIHGERERNALRRQYRKVMIVTIILLVGFIASLLLISLKR